ncbi:hypothetical protein J2T56_003155 [Natronobacillus azotifigens]|uniref:TraX family protein n=1 Tax=Natronobacillus azotifigens TaxID=472978 RepID=UPI003D214AFE
MSNTKLKIFALVIMFIDHVGQFLPNTPEWFNWIGRIVAPIFIYFVVVGVKHTSNKKKYLIRLYVFSLFMAIINMSLNQIFDETNVYIWNNFFSSLFLVALVIVLLEHFKVKYLLLLSFWQIISFIICVLIVEWYQILELNYLEGTYYFWGSIFANIIFVEGSYLGVVIGLIFYISRFEKLRLIIFYSGFILLFYLISIRLISNIGPISQTYFFPFSNYQWMMFFALPFLLLYNGERGQGLKYLFYIFYPLHLIIIFLIAQYMI